MDEVMELEGSKEWQNKIDPCGGIENRVFWVGQKGLPISVGIRPEREISFLQKLWTKLPEWNFEQGHVALIKDAVGKKEFPEKKEKKEKKGKQKQ